MLRLSGSRSEYLASLGVPDEVIQWVEAQEASAQNIYANALRQNPSLTVDALALIPLPRRADPQEVYNNFEQNTAMNYAAAAPQFAQWLMIQIRKMRKDREGQEYHLSKMTIINDASLLYDWYRYSIANSGQDDQGQPRFQIASYDWNGAKKMSEEWHAMMAGKGSGLMFEPIKEENVVYSFRDGHTIQLVTSENDLQAEGNKLNHCVGGYCEDVKNGESVIYSLRDEINSPIATIELNRDGAVVQIQGHSNTEPAEEYTPYIREWVENLPNPIWRDKQPIEYKLKDVDKSEIGTYLASLVEDKDKYGLKRDFDSSDINPERLIEEVMERFIYSHDYRNDHYADSAVDGLLQVLIKNDIHQAERHKKSKNAWYYFRMDTAYKVADDMWDDYRGKYEKELMSDLKDDLVEPFMPNINYRDYDDDEDYEHDYRQAQEEYERLHAEWEHDVASLPDVAENNIEKWSKDDLQARFLKTLRDGLKSNADKLAQELMKYEKDRGF